METMDEKEKFEGLSFLGHLSAIEDPRIERHKLYPLEEIFLVAFCCVLCGGESFQDLEDFGNLQVDFLKGYLPFSNGIPSHDTYARVFSLLDPKEFGNCLLKWAEALRSCGQEGVIAIDGKTLRHSFNKAKGQSALHIVSAFASHTRLVLGQVKVQDKSNEITAIPELLKMLDIRHATVTIDAMGCQKEIANQIKEQKAEYVLALKGNQGDLKESVETFFKLESENNFKDVSVNSYQEVDKDHGRIETRKCIVTGDISCIENPQDWNGIRSIIMLQCLRDMRDKQTRETRYYISSLPPDPQKILHAIRAHWSIENTLHWTLDVTFREDDSRIRVKNAPENMAILRRFTLNILQKVKQKGDSIKRMRKKAGWNNKALAAFLEAV